MADETDRKLTITTSDRKVIGTWRGDDVTNEDFAIELDGKYIGSFYFSTRLGKPAIVFGASDDEGEDSSGDWLSLDEHPRSAGDGALLLPEGVWI
jgi:hypothetical protein